MLLGSSRRRHQSDPGGYKQPPASAAVNQAQVKTRESVHGSTPRPDNGDKPTNFTPFPILDVSATPVIAPTVDPLVDEFDEYGTELHKDARVWKVYVKETDKHDAELVKGWNDSTDVILIFAALFSAISAAFIVESTKTLKQDPADVSSQTLLLISQTLLTIANGTLAPGGVPLPPKADPTTFAPPRLAVCVNTLWYLSLSLSLATSFIAILAKDWCHAFMTGRTGHPYSQTCRRQSKWNMIERWKMSELLAVLPSMIHLALLLFSIGLCIQLWDVHPGVALPVILVSGAAILFYLCSSIAAIFFDSFPFPTIISRLCRTQSMRQIYQKLSPLWVLTSMIRIIAISAFGITRIYWVIYYLKVKTRYRPLPLRMLGLLLGEALKFIIWYPASIILRCLVDLSSPHTGWERTIFGIYRPTLRFEKPIRQSKECSTTVSRRGQELYSVTSLALGWLIQNCEEPQAVDIALQAIAGANENFSREPLEECNATLEILRRLASSTLYRGKDAEKVLSLYARALSFISYSKDRDSSRQHSSEGELQVLVWDLQTRIERNVALLITDGQFQPSKQNLSALRIGSTIASRGLQLLQADTENADKVLETIIHSLTRHLSKDEPLHPSSLLLLVNAGALLSLFANNPSTVSLLPNICLEIAHAKVYTGIPQLRMALIACALLHNRHVRQKLSSACDAKDIVESVRWLVDIQLQSEQLLGALFRFGLEELWNSPERYSLNVVQPGTQHPIIVERDRYFDPNDLFQDLPDKSTNEIPVQYLQAIHRVYNLVPVGRPPPRTYVFLLRSVFYDPPTRHLCWQLLSGLQFPKDSHTLASCLSKGLGSNQLRQAENGEEKNKIIQFFAQGQLWLFLTHYLSLPFDAPHIMLLRNYLAVDRQGDIIKAETRHNNLGAMLEQQWQSSHHTIAESLGTYAYRLMECVFQSLNCPISEQIYKGLHDVSQELRGLCSFTDWRPNSDEVGETTGVVEGLHHEDGSQNSEEFDVIIRVRSSNKGPRPTGDRGGAFGNSMGTSPKLVSSKEPADVPQPLSVGVPTTRRQRLPRHKSHAERGSIPREAVGSDIEMQKITAELQVGTSKKDEVSYPAHTVTQEGNATADCLGGKDPGESVSRNEYQDTGPDGSQIQCSEHTAIDVLEINLR